MGGWGAGLCCGVGVCGRGAAGVTKPKLQVRQVFLSERDTMRAATHRLALVILVALFSCLAVAASRTRPPRVRCRSRRPSRSAPSGSPSRRCTYITRRTTWGAEAPRRPTFVLGLVSFSALCLAAVALLALTCCLRRVPAACTRPLPLELLRERLLLVLLSLLGLVPCCRLVGTCARPPRCACSGASGRCRSSSPWTSCCPLRLTRSWPIPTSASRTRGAATS